MIVKPHYSQILSHLYLLLYSQ